MGFVVSGVPKRPDGPPFKPLIGAVTSKASKLVAEAPRLGSTMAGRPAGILEVSAELAWATALAVRLEEGRTPLVPTRTGVARKLRFHGPMEDPGPGIGQAAAIANFGTEFCGVWPSVGGSSGVRASSRALRPGS